MTNRSIHVHFRLPPHMATLVEQAAFACRTTKRALWIAAMREFLGEEAREPGRAVSASMMVTKKSPSSSPAQEVRLQVK